MYVQEKRIGKMKAKRFMREFASYQLKEALNNPVLSPEALNAIMKQINGAIQAYERGFITVQEAMRLIALDGLDLGDC